MDNALRKILFDPTIARIVALVLGLVVIAGVVRLGQRVGVRHLHDPDTRYRVRKVVAFAGYIAAVVLVVMVYSNQLTGLAVGLGVAGAGIAFALQEPIASVAAWIALSLSRWYAPGDRIKLGGIMGDVIDIGILRTTVMECGEWVNGDLYNGRIVRIANSNVFKQPVVNYSGDFPFLWDEIRVPVRYGSDLGLARALLEKVVEEVTGDYSRHAKESWAEMVSRYRIEDAQVDPMVTLVATDNWLDFTVRYVVDYRRRRGTKDRLFTRILEELDRAHGQVLLASTTLELVPSPTMAAKPVLPGPPPAAPPG